MISHAELLRLLRYDPETGVFTRLVRTSNSVRIGDVAGATDKDGYRVVSVGGREYKAHRLAWFYVTGEWPSGDIDHRDRDTANNRFLNLREATRSQNLANKGKSATNKSGLKGVCRIGERWRATVSLKNRQIHLGVFDCPAAAHLAYAVGSNKIHGEFARTA